MLDSLSCMGSGVAVRTMKDMRHFFIRSLTQGALGMVLVIPVKELVTNP